MDDALSRKEWEQCWKNYEFSNERFVDRLRHYNIFEFSLLFCLEFLSFESLKWEFLAENFESPSLREIQNAPMNPKISPIVRNNI